MFDNKNRSSRETQLSEINPGGSTKVSFAMENITFSMLHAEYQHIREWYNLFSDGNNGK